MCEVDFFEFALQGRGGIDALLTALVVDLKVGEGEGGGLVVLLGDFVDYAYGFGVFPFAHEVFGRFVEGEDNETEEETYHSEPTHCDHIVPPPKVFGFGTRCRLLLGTCMITQERPGHQCSEELRQGPEYREDREEVLMTPWKKLEENGGVDR